jgi:hypothetical protein
LDGLAWILKAFCVAQVGTRKKSLKVECPAAIPVGLHQFWEAED